MRVPIPRFDVTFWDRTAGVAGEYLSKGSPILVEGLHKLDTWETEGQKRSKLNVVAPLAASRQPHQQSSRFFVANIREEVL